MRQAGHGLGILPFIFAKFCVSQQGKAYHFFPWWGLKVSPSTLLQCRLVLLKKYWTSWTVNWLLSSVSFHHKTTSCWTFARVILAYGGTRRLSFGTGWPWKCPELHCACCSLCSVPVLVYLCLTRVENISLSKLRSQDVVSFYKSNSSMVLSSWQAFGNMITYNKITYSAVWASQNSLESMGLRLLRPAMKLLCLALLDTDQEHCYSTGSRYHCLCTNIKLTRTKYWLQPLYNTQIEIHTSFEVHENSFFCFHYWLQSY